MLEELTHNVFLRKILLIFLVTLLPLVPSYILFKFLPSKSIVTGPFKGLQIDFSGATAIYFIIFISVISVSKFWELDGSFNQRNYEVWQVEGRLKADSIRQARIDIVFLPKYSAISRNGIFTVAVLRNKNLNNEWEFPALVFMPRDGDYKSRVVNIDIGTNSLRSNDLDIEYFNSTNSIIIHKPIKLIEN